MAKTFVNKALGSSGGGGSGDVVGPGSSTNGNLAVFDGISGKLLKDGGAKPTGDVVGPAGAVSGNVVLFDGATGKLVKDGGSPATAEVRKIIVSSGGSTAVNNAILALEALGGGLLVLDGLILMDGDITMKSGVVIQGNGTGTGLSNNTANAYAINFVGTTPTYYEISAPDIAGFTCDTVGEAANFAVGKYVLLKDTDGVFYTSGYGVVSIAGDAVSGAVKTIQDLRSIPSINLPATSEAAPLAGAIDQAGLYNLSITNTSSGSISINITYATRTKIQDCYFLESTISVSNSVETTIQDNKIIVLDNHTFSKLIGLGEYTHRTTIKGNLIQGAEYGITLSGINSSMSSLYIQQNQIVGCKRGIYISYTNTKPCVVQNLVIESNTLNAMAYNSTTADHGIYLNALVYWYYIQNNKILGSTSSLYIKGTSVQNSYGFITNNITQTTIEVHRLTWGTFTGNEIGGTAQFESGISNTTISSNNFSSHLYVRDANINPVENNTISSNRVGGFVYFDGDATYPFRNNIISSNYVGSYLNNAGTGGTHNKFIGNHIVGNFSLTDTAGDTAYYSTLIGNTIAGNFVCTEPTQQNCIMSSNQILGTIDPLTGVGCEIEDGTTAYTKEISGSLTQANLVAMNGTPVSLLAAPAAGYTHIIDEIEFFHDYDTAVYTGGGDISVKYDGSTVITLVDGTLVTGNADTKRILRPVIYELDASTGTGLGFDAVTDAAKAIVITNADAAFADGAATNILKYKIKYHTIKLLT